MRTNKTNIISLDLMIVRQDTSIKSTMQIFEKNLQKHVYVVDHDKSIVGAVSDGDVRRAILSGVDISRAVNLIMNENFKSIASSQPRSDALKLMRNFNLSTIPVVSSYGKIVEIVHSNSTVESTEHENMIYIMAGGLGKRLRPLTENTPKPMLYIGNRPILEIIIKRLADQGFGNFTIVVNFLAEQIVDYFKDGQDFGVKIDYIHEQMPLGTCGALSKISSQKLNDPIIVTNGDLLTDIDYSKLLNFYQSNDCDGLMCIKEESFKVPYGVVKSEVDEFIRVEEKPEMVFSINAGIYVLNKKIIDLIPPDQKLDITDLFNKAKDENAKVKIFKSNSFWLDIGYTEQYHRAVEMFS